MKELSIDIETFSSYDIRFGVHKYVEADDFEILLFAYSYGNNVHIVDLANGEKIPEQVKVDMFHKDILKTAYNASFEIACLSKYLGTQLDQSQWSCTMALGAQAGYPFGLDKISKIFGKQLKDNKGKALIRYFCIPCKPTKTNNNRHRNFPLDDYDKWLDFRNYCVQDVVAEMAIRKQLCWFEPTFFEKELWIIDQKINTIGVQIDLQLVKKAIELDSEYSNEIIDEMKSITGLSNPNSVVQLKKYIASISGVTVKSLSKADEDQLQLTFKNHKDILYLLDLKKKSSRTSIKKYHAMFNTVNKDSIARGLFQYYGARTGRWSGRNIQLQNLKSNYLSDLDIARKAVKKGSLDTIKLLYEDPGEVLSNLIRTAFIPKTSYFIISDFSAIEARIVAWLAQEEWRLEVFKTHGKIYEASASKMFKIPIEQVTKEIRNKGKVAELALGYQGALGALQRMGGQKIGLTDSEMMSLVIQWRAANKKIVKLWHDVEVYAKHTILHRTEKSYGPITFKMIDKNLLIVLPSGRPIVYVNAKVENYKLSYTSTDDLGNWGSIKTYGGKLIENIVQAIARDVLAYKMRDLYNLGYDIVMHVHDEIIVESNNIDEDVPIVKQTLSSNIYWAKGLVLKEETFVSKYYKK